MIQLKLRLQIYVLVLEVKKSSIFGPKFKIRIRYICNYIIKQRGDIIDLFRNIKLMFDHTVLQLKINKN